MFLFQIFLFLITVILLSFSINGHGKLVTKNFKNDFFSDFFFGLIVVSFIVTILHFFLSINLLISSFIFLFGLILFFKDIKINNFKFLEKKKIIYLVVILLLMPMFISQKYHEDFGYYHLPYALALLEEKIVFGFANIDKPYVFNSIWLNLNSIFFLQEKNFDFLTMPSFLLFVIFIIFSINQLIDKKRIENSDYYLLVILFYFILKFTRISEFGLDLPAIIFSILSIYYFIKFFEFNEIYEKKKIFYFNLAFSVFSILIKLSTVPIIILTFYLYLKNFKEFKFYIFSYKFLFIYLLFIIFFSQQFIYTGCIFFPTSLTCFDVSWFNTDYINLSKQIELINKSYSKASDIYLPKEYLENFNWFPFWIKRNYVEFLEHLTTIILPTLFFIFFLNKKETYKYELKEKKTIYFFLIINLFFWLNFSPVYRFGVHLFITFSFIILLGLLISREFSKEKFIIFVLIFLIFSFSKNILRIQKQDEVFLGIQKIENLFLLNNNLNNEYIKIYYPDIENNRINGWQGRLCWNTPFICSFNGLDVKKKNGYLIINKIKN